jgi:hypothetical protein
MRYRSIWERHNGARGTRVQRCNGARAQRCNGARAQGCNGARAQGCKGRGGRRSDGGTEGLERSEDSAIAERRVVEMKSEKP